MLNYQEDVNQFLADSSKRQQDLNTRLTELQTTSKNTKIIRASNYPDDYVSHDYATMKETWSEYPMSGLFKVDSDEETIATADMRISAYGVIVRVDFLIEAVNGTYVSRPTDTIAGDTGLFYDRRFGGNNISSISREQLFSSYKLPRGEYSLKILYLATPIQGLFGISEVSVGVKGL